MSEYLDLVMKSLQNTQICNYDSADEDYKEGWLQCQEDLSYGISLGSDHAVMQQIKYWTDPLYGDVMVEDQGDVGYADRMKEIHKLIGEI